MNSVNVDQQISNFLSRKHAEFPELANAGRNESRTAKYAAVELRNSGQLLYAR